MLVHLRQRTLVHRATGHQPASWNAHPHPSSPRLPCWTGVFGYPTSSSTTTAAAAVASLVAPLSLSVADLYACVSCPSLALASDMPRVKEARREENERENEEEGKRDEEGGWEERWSLSSDAVLPLSSRLVRLITGFAASLLRLPSAKSRVPWSLAGDFALSSPTVAAAAVDERTPTPVPPRLSRQRVCRRILSLLPSFSLHFSLSHCTCAVSLSPSFLVWKLTSAAGAVRRSRRRDTSWNTKTHFVLSRSYSSHFAWNARLSLSRLLTDERGSERD